MRFFLFFVATPAGIIMIALSDWLERGPYWIVVGSVLLCIALMEAMRAVLLKDWHGSLRSIASKAGAGVTVPPAITAPPVLERKKLRAKRKKTPYKPFELPRKRQRRRDLRAMESHHARSMQSSCDSAARAFNHQVVRR